MIHDEANLRQKLNLLVSFKRSVHNNCVQSGHKGTTTEDCTADNDLCSNGIETHTLMLGMLGIAYMAVVYSDMQ